jgi:hypothetical protein
MTVDSFTFFIAMLPHVEEIDLSNTAMTRSYLQAELQRFCGTPPKMMRTEAVTTQVLQG